jgi:MmyB-like transcription regulator ligand binding domain
MIWPFPDLNATREARCFSLHVGRSCARPAAQLCRTHPAFQLALRQPVIEGSQRERVSSATQRMLDQLDSISAFIRGRRWEILAWNRAALAFFCDFEKVPPDERNLVWLFFTRPALRSLIGVDWRAGTGRTGEAA